MNIGIHEVAGVYVSEIIEDETEYGKYYVRELVIFDEDGNKHRITLYANTRDALLGRS